MGKSSKKNKKHATKKSSKKHRKGGKLPTNKFQPSGATLAPSYNNVYRAQSRAELNNVWMIKNMTANVEKMNRYRKQSGFNYIGRFEQQIANNPAFRDVRYRYMGPGVWNMPRTICLQGGCGSKWRRKYQRLQTN